MDCEVCIKYMLTHCTGCFIHNFFFKNRKLIFHACIGICDTTANLRISKNIYVFQSGTIECICSNLVYLNRNLNFFQLLTVFERTLADDRYIVTNMHIFQIFTSLKCACSDRCHLIWYIQLLQTVLFKSIRCDRYNIFWNFQVFTCQRSTSCKCAIRNCCDTACCRQNNLCQCCIPLE